jgi:glycosyltransferase involved in cell wall biosynthesis
MHRSALRQADAYRTQQVTGSWTALIAKALYRKPLLFRVGYPLSVRFRTEGKRLNYALARLVELLSVRFADHVAVASMTMRDYYGALGDKNNVTWVPNFVDVSRATLKSAYDRRDPVLFVGRLHKVKNIENIIRACARLNVALHLYHGPGDLRDYLQKVADEVGATIVFRGTVPNEELFRRHHEHSIFILCSTREGMPKAMIEAMASGLICVATPTDGASELIVHGKTGYLTSGYDADAIEATLAQALREMNPEIGRQAREFVVANLSLDRAVEVELGLFRRIIARHHRQPGIADAAAPENTTDTHPLK